MAIQQTPPAIVDPPRPKSLKGEGALAVELRDVTFFYRQQQPVLSRLNLAIRPGEKVAIVGTSGSGKSSIARLLTRMYDPCEGRVLLNRISACELRLRDLRSSIALVPQDPVLFDVSLKENMLYANPKASDAELRQVLSMAQLDQTLSELPNGWFETVGRRGELLSGGQRQRVAIARAILQNPRLLILDEATSALDGFTEHRLLHCLDDFIRNRTVLMIAHRLSAILWTDRIIVLDGGEVVGEGHHNDLYRECEAYHLLCNKQMEKASLLPEGLGRTWEKPKGALAL